METTCWCCRRWWKGVVVGGSGPIYLRLNRGNPKIDFGTIEFNPASRNQEEEYIALVNKN